MVIRSISTLNTDTKNIHIEHFTVSAERLVCIPGTVTVKAQSQSAPCHFQGFVKTVLAERFTADVWNMDHTSLGEKALWDFMLCVCDTCDSWVGERQKWLLMGWCRNEKPSQQEHGGVGRAYRHPHTLWTCRRAPVLFTHAVTSVVDFNVLCHTNESDKQFPACSPLNPWLRAGESNCCLVERASLHRSWLIRMQWQWSVKVQLATSNYFVRWGD